MTQIDAPKALRAYVPLPPKLSQILEKDLCKSKLLGKCSNSSCTKEHSIRIVSEAEGPVSQLLPQNTVSHAPRSALQNSKLFNNQSPQNSKTHKHDNDHTLIEDIDILPTTDEVRLFCYIPYFLTIHRSFV